MKKFFISFAAGLMLSLPGLSSAQSVLGIWEYPGFGIIKMTQENNTFHMVRYFNDGSRLEENLVKDEGEYISTTIRGQWYQIDFQGNLKMFDSYGLIRILSPIKE